MQLLAAPASAQSERWMTLPPTPSLPTPASSGKVEVNGASIWYAVFGKGVPVVLLHGGLANSNYWGNQVPGAGRTHQVIVIDSRGHGRSTRSAAPYGYELMAVRRAGRDGQARRQAGGDRRLERRGDHRPVARHASS